MNAMTSNQPGATSLEDNEEEIFLEPCAADAVFSTPYRDLIAYNGTSLVLHFHLFMCIIANIYRQL
jgi:hypothetical protein